MTHSFKKVPWTFAPKEDQLLRDGFSLLITNKKTQGYLVVDLGKRALGLDEAYVPSVTPQHPGPVSRSIFVIKKVDKSEGDLIRYGDKVKIEVNPYLNRKTLWLSSQPITPTVYSPVTSQHEVSVTSKDSALNNTWVIDYLDPNFRLEKQGSPIECNDPVLIRHVGTNHFLASDLNRLQNDFGTEYEVTVHNYSSKNLSQNLEMEKAGRITGDVPSKFQEAQNIFYFVTAPGPQYSASVEELNTFTSADLIKEIKAKIEERAGFKGLLATFKAMDLNGNGLLDVDDFRWGLMEYGVSLSKDEGLTVLKHFDKDGSGSVDFNEFLSSLGY